MSENVPKNIVFIQYQFLLAEHYFACIYVFLKYFLIQIVWFIGLVWFRWLEVKFESEKWKLKFEKCELKNGNLNSKNGN